MVSFLWAVVAASALGVAWGNPLARRTLQLHEARAAAPSGYTLISSASPDTVLNLRVALVQSNIDGLLDTLYDVSDPESPNYGEYLTKEEVEAYVKPTQDSVEAVNAWLGDNNLTATPVSPSGDWVEVNIPVSKANELLDTDFSVFRHEVTGTQTIRALQYSIPVDLAEHVDLIHPITSFPVQIVNNTAPAFVAAASPHIPAVTRDTSNVTAVCGPYNRSNITVACLQYLYGIPTTTATNPDNGIVVAGYVEQYANANDLKIFLEQYRPDINPSTTFATETIDGGSNLQNVTAGSEGNLDIQYTVGLATGVPVTYLLAGNDTHDGLSGYLDTVNYVLNQASPPPVMTTSYSANEDVISEKLAYNLCNAYAQLGARGVSILFSSGDGGVSGTGYQDCTTFVPTFPNTCPYVTSVGATGADINWADQQGVPFSGGGFSNYFPMPTYQSSAVSAYLKQLGSNDTGLYNASGRGFPDVSGFGVDFATVVGGAYAPTTGTSCSTPMWASVIALLNDELLNVGKPVLGFLNPWLYSKAAGAVTDIVKGNNKQCLESDGSVAGFVATTGWDPVTGLGTPLYDKLRAAAGL
ncbi:family S53 protease [Fomitopsis serialis]|uniref:family S53 protease n=1 Tax=Fomitopsis serialis TaxID=139415 RepID=UPI0020084693|nr:family S53 protease [Neoantrodia serialis]KAH9915907.1 family S53 protease [Neoantrodia serialis]